MSETKKQREKEKRTRGERSNIFLDKNAQKGR